VLDIDLTATNNEIRGWGRGVNITQCAGSCSGASYQAVTIRHNLIAGNGAGFDNSSAGGFGVSGVRKLVGSAQRPGDIAQSWRRRRGVDGGRRLCALALQRCRRRRH
jgi:hypothetical protein